MLSIYRVTHSNKFMNDKKFYQVVSEHLNKQIYEQISIVYYYRIRLKIRHMKKILEN
jgi:hypothetical protein